MTYMQKLNQARSQAKLAERHLLRAELEMQTAKDEARKYLRVNIELSEQVERLLEENRRLKTQNEELMVPSW